MKSLSKLYRMGPGPSSSHTIAPYNAAKYFQKLVGMEEADRVEAIFYGSLALTGIGHKSEFAISDAFKPWNCHITFDVHAQVEHPLTMDFIAYKGEKEIRRARYISLGGGEIHSDDDLDANERDIYPFRNFKEIKSYMSEKGYTDLKDFCLDYEDPSIEAYLLTIVKGMIASVKAGLEAEGQLPANKNPRLQMMRAAKKIHGAAHSMKKGDGRKEILLTSYAYAVAEESACGKVVVTAPTCGSSGVLPSAIYYLHTSKKIPLTKLRDALYTAGVIGNIVKQNASVAGSIGGCQAEIGTASSMAAALWAYVNGLSLYQIEYAAECAMEHFLGLSCDPVDGYVLIPCIERNGIGAIRGNAAYLYAKFIAPMRQNQVSFDDVVGAMKLTGDSLSKAYKETAEGGLAEVLKETL